MECLFPVAWRDDTTGPDGRQAENEIMVSMKSWAWRGLRGSRVWAGHTGQTRQAGQARQTGQTGVSCLACPVGLVRLVRLVGFAACAEAVRNRLADSLGNPPLPPSLGGWRRDAALLQEIRADDEGDAGGRKRVPRRTGKPTQEGRSGEGRALSRPGPRRSAALPSKTIRGGTGFVPSEAATKRGPPKQDSQD